MTLSAIVLELGHNGDACRLGYSIGDQPVHCVVRFCLRGVVRANDSGEIDMVVVVELGSPAKRLPDLPLAVSIVVIGIRCILGITRAATRISDVILVANGVVMEPSALAGDSGRGFAKVFIV